MKRTHPISAQFSQRAIRNTLLLVCVGTFCLMQQAHGDAPPVKEKLHVTELLKDVGIIGKLGFPLGTLVTVRGTWSIEERKTWEGTVFFDVTSVNGKQMPQAVEFARVSPVDPSEGYPKKRNGEEWELCCYELGFFDGEPATYWEERKKASKFGAVLSEPGRAFGFGSKLIYVKRNRK